MESSFSVTINKELFFLRFTELLLEINVKLEKEKIFIPTILVFSLSLNFNFGNTNKLKEIHSFPSFFFFDASHLSFGLLQLVE